jgi:hypothetical protein
MAIIVRYVLAKMKPGVSARDYERFEREVDYVFSARMRTIVSYRTHRILGAGERLQGGPWDYLERIQVTDRKAYEDELAREGTAFLEELYGTYLDRSYTTSIWTELIEP